MSSAERRRSSVLASYGALDAPREPEFDDIAAIASEVCGTPIAVVNLVDTTRQFFMAEVGLGVRETPLESSFCAQAILSEDMMVIPDATKDPRFDCNPLVTDEPHLRFYAGALMKTAAGVPIGTVCVLDYRPRDLNESQIRTLRLLARQAMTQFELRKAVVERNRALKTARETERRFRSMADDAPAIIWVTDTDGRCVWLNRGWYDYTGMTKWKSEGFGWLDAVHPDDREESGRIFFEANAKRIPFSLEYRLCRHDGRYRWAVDTGAPRFHNGVFEGYVGTVIDIEDRRQAEMRREMVVRESSHRLKNAFSIIQSIAGQTLRQAATIEEARATLPARLLALASAQDLLSQTENPAADVRAVVESAIRPYMTEEGRFRIEGPPAMLSGHQAFGLVLAVHELATNAVKYGALSVAGGHVAMHWNTDPDGTFEFTWKETDGPPVSSPSRRGFGTRLVERTTALYFDGTSSLDFDVTGVRFRLLGKLQSE
ncbi:sensor histidine kinase [Fulvimarina manganoxydans]|uniref:sensor histidine kinase n=1 Tax=Fulvimarina manganoxydans TaxID=937218 RepID=UPI00111C6B59|nr:HWE histidine kinase domain-containing protein [Fulvimarina manganoxydans]